MTPYTLYQIFIASALVLIGVFIGWVATIGFSSYVARKVANKQLEKMRKQDEQWLREMDEKNEKVRLAYNEMVTHLEEIGLGLNFKKL